MKKKINVSLICLLAIFAFTGCGEDEKTEKETATTTVTQQTTTIFDETTKGAEYEKLEDEVLTPPEASSVTIHEGENYSMCLYSDWSYEDRSGLDFFVIKDKEVQVSIVPDTSGMTTSLEESKNTLCNLYDSTEGYDVVSVGNVTINGNNGVVINYTITMGENSYKGKQYLVEANDVFYAITFLASEAEYANYEQSVKEMIGSFHAAE